MYLWNNKDTPFKDLANEPKYVKIKQHFTHDIAILAIFHSRRFRMLLSLSYGVDRSILQRTTIER